MNYLMSVNLHLLCSHLDFFQENFGDLSEGHGERFCYHIDPMKRRYQGRWKMGDYFWSLVREDKSAHKRIACSTAHF